MELIRVLHINDDVGMLNVFKDILAIEAGFEVDSAISIEAAFEKIQTTSYDVIVLGYELLKENGLQFLKKLRAQKNQASFILFARERCDEVTMQALDMGADGYICNQGDLQTVYGELKNYIQLIIEKNRAKQNLTTQESLLKKIASQWPGVLYQFKMNLDGTFCVPFSSDAIKEVFGCSPQEVETNFTPIAKVIYPQDYDKVLNSIKRSGENLTPWICEYRVQIPGKSIKWLLGKSIPEKQTDGSIIWSGYTVDITEQKRQETEIAALLEGARSILKAQTFDEAARDIFDSCKKLIGAAAGYVALLSEDGLENKVLFLDSGGLSCTVNPNLPMPIRGLREIAYQTGKVVYENNFSTSKWTKFLPAGHVNLGNIMFAPLVFNKKVVALIGLANKPTEFTEKDAQLASAFSEYATIALNNSWALTAIQNKEKQLSCTLKELEASHTKLKTVNEKLQFIGSLTRHDIRNKLMIAKTNMHLLKKKVENKPELIRYIKGIGLAINQSDKIVEFGSLYEKIDAEQPTQIDVGACFDQAATLIPNIELKIINKCHGLILTANSMMRQLFYNLIDNSLKHGKTVTQIQLYYIQDEEKMWLIYEDNGIGIPKSSKDKIFSEGFTTGSGTGLGLKLVKKMVAGYGWVIKETGIPGKGAKFEITIQKQNNGQTMNKA